MFLDDDTAGALELQADEDVTCPRGHHLDETVGDEGPEIGVSSFVCEACGAEDSARRQAQREVESAGGENAADLLDGRYFVATVAEP